MDKLSVIKTRIKEIISSSKDAIKTYEEESLVLGHSELYRANAHAKIYTIHKMEELLKLIDSLE